MAVRCKVQAWSVEDQKTQEGEKYAESVKLSAVYSPDPTTENYSWSQATPSAQFDMWITNPGAFGSFEANKEYFVDFTPAE